MRSGGPWLWVRFALGPHYSKYRTHKSWTQIASDRCKPRQSVEHLGMLVDGPENMFVGVSIVGDHTQRSLIKGIVADI